MELIRERPYDSITVEELTDRADVGRSTFYSHYGSKEDLLFSGFDDWLLSLADQLAEEAIVGSNLQAGEEPARFRFSLPLLRHIREHERFFRATLLRGANARVRRRTIEILAEVVRREGGPGSTTDEAAAEAHAHAVVGAFLEFAAWWLESGRQHSAEEADRLLHRSMRLQPKPPL